MSTEKITKQEKLFYPLGILGQNMIYNFMAMYMLFFFTDILLIPASAASIILVFAGLWDALNDPMMGIIADRTRTKWGKFRPYLIFGSLPAGIITILCYTNMHLSAKATIGVMAVVYVLWGMIYTSTDIPIWALSSVSSADGDERNNLITLGKIGATVGVVIVTVLSVPVLNLFGGERNASSYTISAVIFAGSGVILMFILGLVSKERVVATKEKVPLKKNLQIVYKNKPLLLLLISLFALNFSNSIRQSVQIYFAIYTWGSANYATFLGLALVIGMTVGMIVTPALIKKFYKRDVFIASCLLAIIASVIPYFVDYSNIVLGLVCIMLNFCFVGIGMISSTSMLIDTIDYAEKVQGSRCEGIVFSMNTFVTKLGGTVAKLILGAILVALNYVESMESSPALQRGFSFAVFIIPALAFVVTLVPLFFYKLGKEKL